MSSDKSSGKSETSGDGLRSVKTTNVFRLLNFELYTKPNIAVMSVGLACFAGVIGYIAYMRSNYKPHEFDDAPPHDDRQRILPKESNWYK